MSSSNRNTLVLSLGLALGAFAPTLVSAANVNIGCTSGPGVAPPSFSQPGYTSSLTVCQDRCSSLSYGYSYYSPPGSKNYNVCYCSNGSPDQPQNAYKTSDSNQACFGTYGFTATMLNTEYAFEKCIDNAALTASGLTGTPYEEISAGLASCASSPQTILLPDQNGFTAYCNSGKTFTSTTCDATTGYILSHAVAPSGIPGKRARLRAAALRREMENRLCPGVLTACAVPNSSAYECIDVASELESCGGCAEGLFNDVHANSTRGTDCTSVPGVARGAVTCLYGACAAFACESGWTLEQGACVKA